MPAHISTLFCDRQKTIIYILADELSLVERMNTKNLEILFADDSQIKLNMLFDKMKTRRSALNWELNTKMPRPYNKVYCSILSWLNIAMVRISDQPIQSFFFDLIVENDKPATLFYPFQSNTEDEKMFKYTRLNNELTSIQRELQRKNVRLEELNERLEMLATTDPLTGLYNRHTILDRARTEFVRAKRENRLFGMAILDLDQLQKINDKYGYPVGDECLKLLAKAINDAIRSYDHAGRIGADEFLVFFSINSEIQFNSILNRLLRKIHETKIDLDNGEVLQIKVSIGGVCFTSAQPDLQVKDMLIQAGKALYASKKAGGNQITLKKFNTSTLRKPKAN